MERNGSQESPDRNTSDRDISQWQQVRALLIGPEQRQLAQILDRLNDPLQRIEEVSQALPDAITLGTSQGNRIARALQPTIDAVLKRSADKNPKALADAIFPVLGPAIRKAVSAALTGMVQSLNQMLNQSFSLNGLKWRLEALRTRKSFAEVVLMHTLVYRVEQIFLIHRQSGILLHYADAEHDESKDPDLVSGMLSAIQEFVRDSFDTKTGEMLDTLRMDGDHSVWIEQGPHAVLAAVIRGMPPVGLRTRFREILDRVHQLYGHKLAGFHGQTSAFDMIKPEFEDALTFKVRELPTRLSPLFWAIAFAGLVILILWSWQAFTAHRQWQTFLSQLRAERGIVVTTAQKTGGQYYIAGLRDPLSRDMNSILADAQMDPARIQSQWQPFYALDDATVMQRAEIILQPPSTITLRLSNGILAAAGRASHQWVKRFRDRAGSIPGIRLLDESGLQDIEMNALRSAIADLEQQVIYFELGQWLLDANQGASLSAAQMLIERIQSLNQSMRVAQRITIIGRTDPTGGRAFNFQLSQRRAQAVMSYLIQHDIDPVNLQAVGATSQASATRSQPSQTGNDSYRRVIFKVAVEAE